MSVPVTLNPVLRRELTERMRGWRACIVLTLYLALIAGTLYVAYQVGRNTNDSPSDLAASFNAPARVGRGIFEYVLFLMLLLVLFMVPGQTSGAVAGERERQTLIPLQVTLLRPRSIVLGKVGAAVAFLVLLLVATTPLLAVCYLIGGVSIGEVLGGVAMVLAVGLAIACLCTAISTFCRRVQFATVLSYGLVLFLVAGTLATRQAAEWIDEARGKDEATAPGWLLLGNPVATVADVVDDGEDFGVGMRSPFDWMEETLAQDESAGAGFSGGEDCVEIVSPDGTVEGEECDGDGAIQAAPAIDPSGRALQRDDRGPDEENPFWWQSLLLLAVAATVAVAGASWRLRTPANKER
jgi:ABC-2 family transporter